MTEALVFYTNETNLLLDAGSVNFQAGISKTRNGPLINQSKQHQ